MSKALKIAAVQMDAMPAPVSERLRRAEKIVVQAAQAGAQLVVLPELFNLGYAYADDNFARAEPLDGVTSRWMKATSTRLGVHLAGTLLLFDGGEIYNTMLLFSPSGRMWRYDKNYPWAWERAYFRGRRGMTVAHTELGDLGLMICWDLGHRALWNQYAGKADMIVIASCPPDVQSGSYDLPGAEKIDFNDVGVVSSMKDVGNRFFGEMVNEQAKWLGIPVVNSGASGCVQTHIPKAKALLRMFSLFAPRLIKLLPKAEQLQMSCDMISSCKVVDAGGSILARRLPTDGEGFVVSEVRLADSKSMPTGPQPHPPLDRITAGMAILNSDVFVPTMMKSVYEDGLKKITK